MAGGESRARTRRLRQGGTWRFHAGTIFVTHTTGENYHALSRVCTHQGGAVNASLPTLNCPCHGSRFHLNGGVSQGPASRALRAWPVTREEDTLTIDFG